MRSKNYWKIESHLTHEVANILRKNQLESACMRNHVKHANAFANFQKIYQKSVLIGTIFESLFTRT